MLRNYKTHIKDYFQLICSQCPGTAGTFSSVFYHSLFLVSLPIQVYTLSTTKSE